MTKHYKRFFLALISLITYGLILWGARYLFPQKSAYDAIVYRYALQYGLQPEFVFAVIKTESNFDPNAHSPKDARGLMQITPDTLNWALMKEGTGEKITAEDLFNPQINIRYGCLILSLLKDEFSDDTTVLAAYNAGRNNVLNWLKDRRYSKNGSTILKTPYDETNNYIKKVQNYRNKFLRSK